jgi:hypothetical protein
VATHSLIRLQAADRTLRARHDIRLSHGRSRSPENGSRIAELSPIGHFPALGDGDATPMDPGNTLH